TGAVITSAEGSASNKNQVLPAATKLAAAVRKALGDDTSESAQIFAMEQLTATSLDVIHEYATAMEALNNGKSEEARQRAVQSTALDSYFGMAYALNASASWNLGQPQDADKYIKLAVAHLDHVTERERYRIRTLYFTLTGDYQKCVEESTALISRYSADANAHSNLGLCSSWLRQMPKAVDEMKRAVAVLPKMARYRLNLSVF